MESEDHLYIPEEIDNNAMLQTFESKRGDEEIPEHIVVNNDKENLVPHHHLEEAKATLVGPITASATNTMHSKLSLLKKKIDSNNNSNRLKPPTVAATSSAYASV